MAYARAASVSPRDCHACVGGKLTLMRRMRHQLPDHRLDDTDVAVEQAPKNAGTKGPPVVGGEAKHKHRKEGSEAAKKQYRLATDTVRQAAPEHASHGLSQREGGDEQAGQECVAAFVADLEPFDHGEGIGKYGSEGDGLGCVESVLSAWTFGGAGLRCGNLPIRHIAAPFVSPTSKALVAIKTYPRSSAGELGRKCWQKGLLVWSIAFSSESL